MKRWFTGITLTLAYVASTTVSACAAETPLVTGNGHGFAVLTNQGKLSGLFAHPYKFEKPDPADALSEGLETADFIKNMEWKMAHNAKLGVLAVSKSGEALPLQVEYINESHVIGINSPTAGMQTYFMPFGLEDNVLIVDHRDDVKQDYPDHLSVEWEHRVKSVERMQVGNRLVRVFQFDQVSDLLAVVPVTRLTGGSDSAADSTHYTFRGRRDWAFITIEKKELVADALARFDRWAAGLSCKALRDRELLELESWRKKPVIRFRSNNERRLWRQSEIILRMAQSREANREDRHNFGLVIASLPDGAWFVPWVRDMAYAVLALIRMGHKDEASLALQAYFNAQPCSKMQKDLHDIPYQVSVVRYFGNGEEEPFFTMEGANNIELDNWGLVLWTLGEYWQQYHDKALLEKNTYRGTVYESAKNFVAKPLLANLEEYKDGLIVRADTSIWEERQKNARHFAYSTIMAIKGLRSFDQIVLARGDNQFHQELQSKITLLENGFMAAFVRDGHLRGTLEPGVKNDVDGAALSAITLGLVNDKALVKQAVSDMQSLKMDSGGYRRVTSIETDPQVFEYWYERQEFLFIDFLMAEVYLKLGMPDKAALLINPIVEKSSRDHGIIPEMYVSIPNYRFVGKVGDATGATPMVGYGAGVFELFMLMRDRAVPKHFF